MELKLKITKLNLDFYTLTTHFTKSPRYPVNYNNLFKMLSSLTFNQTELFS